MKRTLTTLLIGLLIPTASFSQSSYPKILNDSLIVISPTQLKQTNLIFNEYKKYQELIPNYEKKILFLNNINRNWEISDSLKTIRIQNDSTLILHNFERINDLNTSLKKTKKKFRNLTIGGFSLATLFGIFFFIK